ncbi:MAG: 16S rRNA (guanine(966)-N(2))-methyltransferase RsmD [Desulfurivibrio sp.]|nr:16S rRNA (guanine(966)-N(2))-methyltransferase RsmD [Desulfurivibrio sp.]
MRIIGGSCKGRRLLAPGGRLGGRLRPTADRAREGLFNILGPRVRGAAVLDLFAGTGALGLEALSRGAASALLLEQDREVYRLLQRNLALCGFTEPVARLGRRDCGGRLDFLAPLAPAGGFHLVLADPPYGRGLAAGVLRELARLVAASLPGERGGDGAGTGVLAVDALVVLETGRGETLPEVTTGLTSAWPARRYGEALFHFYQIRKNELCG